MAKQKDVRNAYIYGGISVLVVAMVVLGLTGNLGIGELAVTPSGPVDEETGEPINTWADRNVPVDLTITDKFTSADLEPTLKVYEEQPEDWGNPRGDFDEATEYEEYTVEDGEVEIMETSGTYYAVLINDSYNTEFVEIEVPASYDYPDDTLSEYRGAPETQKVKMAQQGATTDDGDDFDFTLTNDTSVTLKDTLLLSVDEDTEFRGWKVVVEDVIGFSDDSDGDGIYDEGIEKVEITVNGVTEKVFDVDNAINEFEPEGAGGDLEFMLDDLVVADEDDLKIAVEIEVAETTSGEENETTDNDEVLGTDETSIFDTTIFDDEGELFATVEVGTSA